MIWRPLGDAMRAFTRKPSGPCQNPDPQSGRLTLRTNQLALHLQPAKRIRFRQSPESVARKVNLFPDVVAVPEADGLDSYATNFDHITAQVESSPSPEV